MDDVRRALDGCDGLLDDRTYTPVRGSKLGGRFSSRTRGVPVCLPPKQGQVRTRMHAAERVAPSEKRPKLTENNLRAPPLPRAPLLPRAPNDPAAHLQAAPSAAREQGAASDSWASCRCVRHARLAQEWDEHRWLDWPLGVCEMLARGPSGAAAAAPRFHATFAGGVHLGCFATAAEAAGAWDAEARRRGQRVLNSPRGSTTAGEVGAAGHLHAALAALPSHALPPLPSDQAWRAAELGALLAAARSPDGGGLKRMWVGTGGVGVGGSVAQHDHCSAAGVQLCWSYQACA